MYIDKNAERINPYAKMTLNGVVYENGIIEFPKVMKELGVKWIDEPPAPADYTPETYFRNEVPTVPYVIYERKSDEAIAKVLLSRYEQALDNHIDRVAQADRWTDRFTFALRAGYPNPYREKALIFAQWMDECNSAAYKLMLDVITGEKPMPASVEAFIALLPPIPAGLVQPKELTP